MRALQRQVVAAIVVGGFVLAATGSPASAGRPAPVQDPLPSVERPAWNGPRVRPGEVLVRFKAGHAPARAAAIGARSIVHLFDGWNLVKLQSGETTDEAIARMSKDVSVAQVTANHIYHSLGVPTDSLFGVQWGMQNTGQTISGDQGTISGTTGADISAPSAWDVTTGSSTVIVGIADTGVAANHPDLAPNVLTGQNFVGDRTPTDTNDVVGHGSHVAGIIGAAGNDGYGVTGVSPHVHILPLRVLDDTGSGDTAWIASGFAYAATHGAKVVNASLGGPDPDPVLEDAIAGHPNTLFVVAAGNNGTNNDSTPVYPCNYTEANLICVAASDQNDALTSFSDYGATSVDLAAPGENIASTYIPDPGGYQSTYSLADSPNGPYANSADTWVQAPASIDPAGKTNCNLTYRLRGRMSPNDYATAETAPAGTTSWAAVDTFGSSSGATTSGAFVARSVGVGSDGMAFNLRFHLVSDPSGTNDGVFIDNIAVVCGSTTISGPYSFESSMSGWTTGGTSQWGRGSLIGVWVYMSGTSMATPFVTGTAALLWAKEPTASVAAVKAAILMSVDKKAAFAGTTVSGGRLDARAALDALPTIDTTPPTAETITGGAFANPIQRSRSFSVGWTATDSQSGVQSYDVEYKRAFYNGSFGPWVVWKNATSSTSATFTGSPGYTYCFVVRARDAIGNLSKWSVNKCTAVPLDDVSLKASLGWTRRTSSLTYMGTNTYGTKRFITLTLTNVSFKHLSLFVTTCKGCGTVEVLGGATNYGWIGLSSTSIQYTKLLPISVPSSGAGPLTITIKIETSGAPVYIDGLGISRV